MFAAFILLAFIQAVTCCGSKTNPNPQIVETEFLSTGYSFVNLIEHDCDNSRSSIEKRTLIAHETDRSTCRNLPHGLAQLQHGMSNNFFQGQSNKRLHDEVFVFSCPNKSTNNPWKNFTIPSEVKYITSIPRTSYEKQLLSEMSLKETFKKDIELSKLENGFVYFLPRLNFHLNGSIRTAAYLSVRVEEYEVAMINLRPARIMMHNYRSLPSQITENVELYYRFINTYGTYTSTSAVLGGRFLILVTNEKLEKEVQAHDISDTTSMSSFINEVLKMQNNELQRVNIIVEGGNSKYRHDIRLWSADVFNDPIPLYTTNLQLNDFIEPVGANERKLSLGRMIDYENNHILLKKVLFQLKILHKSGHFSTFLIESLEKYTDKVCTNADVAKIIQSGIIIPNNIELNKYFIKCLMKPLWVGDKFIKAVKVFNLIPGLCITLHEEIHTCEEFILSFPPGIHCLLMYKQKSCNGKISVSIGSPKKFKDTISKHLSFAFC